MTPRVLDHTMI